MEQNTPNTVGSVSSAHDFYNIMDQNNLVMVYEGEFSQEIMKSVLSMTEKNFDAEGMDANIKKKIFNVMVEILQNICKHQFIDGVKDSNLSAIFMIGFENDMYSIISGNLIRNENIDWLQKKLDEINNLDKEGLKELYKKARLASTISAVGGAGLGFIDMARKSGNRLDYQFMKVNDQASYFYLMSKVSNKKESE